MTSLFTTASGHLRARHRAEWRFRWLGRLAIVFSLGFLLIMLFSITSLGKGALSRAEIQLSIDLSAASTLEDVNFKKAVRTALFATFPEVTDRSDKRALLKLLSSDSGYELARMVEENPALLGQETTLWFTASDDIDMYEKGAIDANLPENRRRLKDTTLGWVRTLESRDALRSVFNTAFFTSGDSREPELAGIFSALVGSILSLIVCFALSFPLGIMAALSLEEFSKKSRWSDFIEVNINNLAAVPSIVFGLLGMAIFLNVFGLPRSSPLVGGMVLALMTLPTIIIASRAALRSVPPSIREAALAMGATRVQTTFHHVLPLAMPGMLTGAIVGMARALGETAPLIMIGMVAFIVDVPQGFTDAATSLPVQIFLWADSPERAFLEKTSAAILVLLGLLIVMNIAAIVLRKKFERRY
ncbi:MAG TPA: phosphate ABC transporter permease PstA [Rhodobacteraceae bacterium]|nr:phosphate ABC transporter permease PstA [Paracoccaceae bacterium]